MPVICKKQVGVTGNISIHKLIIIGVCLNEVPVEKDLLVYDIWQQK